MLPVSLGRTPYFGGEQPVAPDTPTRSGVKALVFEFVVPL